MIDQTRPDLTPEQNILWKYQCLKAEIKRLSEECDAIKETELIPMIENGEMVGYDDFVLVPEFVETVNFNHKAALCAGDISQEAYERWCKPTVSRRLQVRKLKDVKQENALNAMLESQKAIYDQYKAER